ncbi:MAG: PAS domain-containing protein [Spirochaetales bacterium]|nr:PAS domain-containing protein [Spirochaetales bacterium]
MRIPAFLPVILLSLLLFSCSGETPPPGEAVLQRGRLILSEDMLQGSSYLNLTGDAGFYWGQFIDPLQPPPMAEFTEFSEDWGGLYPEQGDVSLRFIIEKNPLVDRLSVSFTSVWCSYRMYVNGKLVSEAGNPSLESGRRQLNLNRMVVVDFPDGSDSLDVVFHISNPYYHRNGVKKFKIGTPDNIDRDFFWKLFYDCVIMGILLAMTVYHFIMAVSKANRTYILFFAFLIFTITYRYFFISTRLVFDVFPHLNMISYDRLQRLGIYPIAGFFITYLYHLYPKIGSKTVVRVIQSGSALFSLLSFLVPPKLVSGLLFTAFYPFFFLTILDALYILTMAVVRREEEAIPMTFGVLLLIGTAVFDMIIDRDLLPARITYQMDKGMIGFIFVQAYIITLRINRAYENEKRFREALQGVQSRLELTVQGAQLGLIEWDILHNTWFLNDNFAEMINFRKDTHVFTRRRWLELVHPDDVKDIEALLKGALTGKIGNFRKEYRLRMYGGNYRWCLLLGKVIQQNKLGGAEWFVGLHIDISEKKIINQDRFDEKKTRSQEDSLVRVLGKDA